MVASLLSDCLNATGTTIIRGWRWVVVRDVLGVVVVGMGGAGRAEVSEVVVAWGWVASEVSESLALLECLEAMSRSLCGHKRSER